MVDKTFERPYTGKQNSHLQGVGFEPTRAERPSELKSDALDHSANLAGSISFQFTTWSPWLVGGDVAQW